MFKLFTWEVYLKHCNFNKTLVKKWNVFWFFFLASAGKNPQSRPKSINIPDLYVVCT